MWFKVTQLSVFSIRCLIKMHSWEIRNVKGNRAIRKNGDAGFACAKWLCAFFTCAGVKQNKFSWPWWDFLSLYRHPKWIQNFTEVFMCFTQEYLLDEVKTEVKLPVMCVVYPATRNHSKYCLWERAVNSKL